MNETGSRTVMHDGKTVAFRNIPDGRQFARMRHRMREKDRCALCKEAFALENTTGVVLVISNQAGIPNRFVHSECMEDKTPEHAFRLIAEDWKEAQKYEGWF